MLYLQQRERQAAQWAFRESKTRRNRNGSVSGCTLLVSGNPGNEDMVYGVIGSALEGMMMDVYEQNLILSILGECALALEKRAITENGRSALAQAKE